MSHQIIIIESITPALQNSEVREHFTTEQCAKVDQIIAGPKPCSDEDFRYLQRRLAQVYCSGD